MLRFLKFSFTIINLSHIKHIDIQPNKYYIHIVSNKFDGSNWSSPVFGFGTVSSHNSEIEVCENEHSSDYKKISDWIDKH